MKKLVKIREKKYKLKKKRNRRGTKSTGGRSRTNKQLFFFWPKGEKRNILRLVGNTAALVVIYNQH